jgi:hypothetical protein
MGKNTHFSFLFIPEFAGVAATGATSGYSFLSFWRAEIEA